MSEEDPGLSAAIRAKATRHRAPDLLRARLRKSIGAETVLRRRWQPLAGAIAASLAIAVGIGVFMNQRSQRDAIEADILASHVRSLMVDHLTDVASSDQHTVKPWFAGKVPFSPPVRDLREQGFPLEGGRLDYIDGHSVAALVYRRHQHAINVFVWPSSSSAGVRESARDGYHVIRWSEHGFVFWAVSDLNEVELREFVEKLRSAG